MGFLDDVKKQAEDAAKSHPEQTEKISDMAIGKGGDLADTLTGGKYADQVKSAEQKADDAV
jgi:hypothetical protein